MISDISHGCQTFYHVCVHTHTHTHTLCVVPLLQVTVALRAPDTDPSCTHTHYIYRPQRSCAKVIFLHVCVILSTAGCACPGGMCARGCVCTQGPCVPRVGGVHAQGGVHARGWGVCVPGCVCMPVGHGTHAPPTHTTRYGWSMRGRYASYWNAFLFCVCSSRPLPRSTTGYVYTMYFLCCYSLTRGSSSASFWIHPYRT